MVDNQDKKSKEFTQIKIFTTHTNDSILQNEVNNWLKENPTVTVQDIKITTATSGLSIYKTCCIIYQKIEEI